jgi:hypothetical protein
MSGTLKLMNDNFTKLSKHTFKNGVKDLAEMSKYSLKFKTNMEGMFNAMDKSRTLEGSLEMASQLMVMGGKFANMDPFTLNFNARNDPKKFQEDINSTLKGLATFNKQSKQFDVSSYDLDRLRSVAEATNMPLESLKESAIQLSKLDLALMEMVDLK